MYKKHISILLSVLIVFNCFGYVVTYVQMQYLFKNLGYEKINSYISENELTKIEINKNDLNENSGFEKIEETEIRYNEKMYDVLKEEDNGNKVVFYCICDENENALQKAFLSFIEANTGSAESNPLLNYIKHTLLKAVTPDDNKICFEKVYDRYIPYNQEFYINYKSDVPFPPPKI